MIRRVKFQRHYQMSRGQLDMAPLIDVVLNLLIYFLLTSSFVMQPGLKIKLPEAKTTESAEPKPIIVSVSADNRLFFEDKEIDWSGLEAALTAAGKRGRFVLLVKGDQSASHGLVVKVLDLARLAGAERLVIATQPE